MKIIVLAICFAVGSVFSSDDVTGEDDNAWTSVCLESIGNCTFEDVNLTWHFDNIKKDCHPGTVCLTSKNRFQSETECKQKCMHVDKMCECTRPEENCEGTLKFGVWNYENGKCTRKQHCARTIFDFSTEKQCKALCMKEEHESSCSMKKLDIKDGTVCWDYLDQRWYYDSEKKRCLLVRVFKLRREWQSRISKNSENRKQFFSNRV
uniref:Putative salivary cysteine and tryptophan rich protein n=1 Tax=Ixodes scapularis TaxID=6945 RepID=Q4PMJ3_IXOSC|nr:putative salivary cysteine and tryptophan rich protein [Ixodes scapularis]